LVPGDPWRAGFSNIVKGELFVSEPSAQQDHSHDVPVQPEKVTGASQSRIAGLTTLPEKRPPRRFFGLLPGRRST
jgi:hypothetical protein